jgi:hypothetical protein
MRLLLLLFLLYCLDSQSSPPPPLRRSIVCARYCVLCFLDICPEHALKARAMAKQAISWLSTGHPDQFDPMMVLKILPKMMNSMVVQLVSKKKCTCLDDTNDRVCFQL